MNKSFLYFVASDLLQKAAMKREQARPEAKNGIDLSRVAVVFPNKRASLFFNEQLAQLAGQPIWSPAYITISDLFRRHSDRNVADSIKLVCDLHKVFCTVTGSNEPLDQFYSWGEVLLSDFDDIDKNMADASKVFANVTNLHQLDDLSYLNDEQRKLLARFFGTLTVGEESVMREKFLKLWNQLYNIYVAYNEHLVEQNMAYEGALYREVATKETLSFRYDHYVFVGFNMLQQVEQHLFHRLQEQGKALFYWDFDHYYMRNHNESGHFIRKYIQQFPNELPSDNREIYCNMERQKTITYISTTSDNAQARYVAQWLRDSHHQESGSLTSSGSARPPHTAVVLCDDSLLQAVVNSLPPDVGSVNVTTGYPLARSPFISLIDALICLQTEGRSKHQERYRLKAVQRLMRHPYASFLMPAHDPLLATPIEHHISHLTEWLLDILRHLASNATDVQDPFFQESLFRTYTLLNRLHQLAADGDLCVDFSTFRRLLRQLVATISVPFHGEPAEGLQVMGVLETRNLDFDHLLVLSCNEGNIPKGINDASFIPYAVRKAYNLTTPDHKVAIYSYYFHSMIQRASDVTFLYNSATSDGKRGEMSRFMLQLMAENPHLHIRRQMLQAPSHSSSDNSTAQQFNDSTTQPFNNPSPIEKDADTVNRLNALTFLAPTDLGRYLRCPLSFYYYRVAKLRQPDDQDPDQLDNRVFGNIFHRAAQLLYQNISPSPISVSAQQIDRLLKDPAYIGRAVDKAFCDEVFHLPEQKGTLGEANYNGLQIINRRVIMEYLSHLLLLDKTLAPFQILGTELPVSGHFRVGKDGRSICIAGIIDRIDFITINGQPCIRVLDYKTGSVPRYTVQSLEEVFDPAAVSDKHTDYYLQTLLYSAILSDDSNINPNALPVTPALLFIQHAFGPSVQRNGRQASEQTAEQIVERSALHFGSESVTDVTPYKKPFEQHLSSLLGEIFDPSQPFQPTQDRMRCANCPYRRLCLYS